MRYSHLFLLVFLYNPYPTAEALNLKDNIAGAGNFQLPVTSYKERRFKTIYKQQYDYSCGSSALASMLTFHYEDIVNEQTVFNNMYKNGNKEKIKKKGFSLLDMKKYLARRGYDSNGFKISLEQLIRANIPAITIINNKGYMHFVIIKGLTNKEVLVGDPAVGVKSIPRNKFEKMWEKHILFLIYDKQNIAANHFQDKKEWKAVVKAQLDLGVDRSSLTSSNLLLPLINDL